MPRRMFRRGFLHHVLDCRLVVRPAGVIAEILIGQFPALHWIGEPIAEAAYLLHLAPGAADHILAHRAFENRRKRATHAARVGPGKIGTRDQSFGLFRAALIGQQRLALPLVRLAVLALELRARGTAISVWPNVSINVRVR